jgi:tetratricopeptide (TPR) repeat protein
MGKHLGRGRYWVLSTMVLAGAGLGAAGGGEAWGQAAAAPAEVGETPATVPSVKAVELRKAGEVSLAEDVGFDKVFKELAQIRAALMARDGNKAKGIADTLVKENAGKPEAYLVRAELLAQFNALADAKKDIDKALELEPENARANAMSAALLGRSGDTTAALEKVEKALKTNPNSAALLAGKADILGTRQDAKGVIDTLKGPAATLKEAEGAAVLNAKLAQAYGSLKMLPEATAAIEKTIKLQPGNPQAVVIKAQILEAGGDVVGAYDTFSAVKAKPGALAGNAQFMTQLDAKIKDLAGPANKLKAQRAQEEKGKRAEAEIKAVQEARAEAVKVMEAYQKDPTDVTVARAAADLMLGLCEQQTGKRDPGPLILVHESEYSGAPVDKASKEVVEARKKAAKVLTDDKTIYEVYYSDRPGEAIKKLEGLAAIYPSQTVLELLAQIYFMKREYAVAARYAALAAGMASLENYQAPLKMDPGMFLIGGSSSTWYLRSAELYLQAKRFESGKLNEADQILADYRDAREKQDWAKAYEVYLQGRSKVIWYSSKNPAGARAVSDHAKLDGKIQGALLTKGRALLKGGDAQAIKTFVDLVGRGYFTSEEMLEFQLAAQQTLGQEAGISLAISKVLEAYPFNAAARMALGRSFEKENKPNDAMYHYNTGAKGALTATLKGDAAECAKARDRIEGTLGKQLVSTYASFVDAERNIANLEKQRHAMVYSAVTRILPSHSNKALLHLVRGQEAFALAMYDECVQDMDKAIELNAENMYLAKMYTGDADYQLSRKDGLDKAAKEKYLKLSAEAYTAAINKAPDKANLASLINARGMRYRDLEESDKAIADLTKAVELFDDRVRNKAWAYMALSKLKSGKGDSAGALEDAKKAVEVSNKAWTGADKAPVEFKARVLLLEGVKSADDDDE